MPIEEVVNVSINTYPTLYASNSLNEAKMKVYDQIFNTIGNGIRDSVELQDAYCSNSTLKDISKHLPNKYISEEKLYQGFTGINDEMSSILGENAPDYSTLIDELLTFNEAEDDPEIKVLREFKKHEFTPYPNFKEEYSLFYQDSVKLPEDWLVELKWFYLSCKEFFLSDSVYNYHYFYPRDSKEDKWNRLIDGYSKQFEKYKQSSEDDAEFYKKVSEAYELEFDGNIVDFIKRRGDKEISRVLRFIDKTVNLIDKQIADKKGV